MSAAEILKKLQNLHREIEYIKRDIINIEKKYQPKPSLFGSVPAGDITEGMIEEAKRSLFRTEDL